MSPVIAVFGRRHGRTDVHLRSKNERLSVIGVWSWAQQDETAKKNSRLRLAGRVTTGKRVQTILLVNADLPFRVICLWQRDYCAVCKRPYWSHLFQRKSNRVRLPVEVVPCIQLDVSDFEPILRRRVEERGEIGSHGLRGRSEGAKGVNVVWIDSYWEVLDRVQ